MNTRQIIVLAALLLAAGLVGRMTHNLPQRQEKMTVALSDAGPLKVHGRYEVKDGVLVVTSPKQTRYRPSAQDSAKIEAFNTPKQRIVLPLNRVKYLIVE